MIDLQDERDKILKIIETKDYEIKQLSSSESKKKDNSYVIKK